MFVNYKLTKQIIKTYNTYFAKGIMNSDSFLPINLI
jgi:hypothetical protein